MYERFTDRGRKVMQLAQQEANRLNHGYVGTEHLLCALIKEGSGVAANVLKNLGLDLSKIRAEIEKHVQVGSDECIVIGKVPLTPRVLSVLRHAADEADRISHTYVGTEHLLLGLLREQEGVAAKVLTGLGLKLEDVRAETLTLLGEPDVHEIGHAADKKVCGLSPIQSAWLCTLKQQIEEVKQQIKELEEADAVGSGFSGRLIPLQTLLMTIGKAKAEMPASPKPVVETSTVIEPDGLATITHHVKVPGSKVLPIVPPVQEGFRRVCARVNPIMVQVGLDVTITDKQIPMNEYPDADKPHVVGE